MTKELNQLKIPIQPVERPIICTGAYWYFHYVHSSVMPSDASCLASQICTTHGFLRLKKSVR